MSKTVQCLRTRYTNSVVVPIKKKNRESENKEEEEEKGSTAVVALDCLG
jgi:hypothetical protein